MKKIILLSLLLILISSAVLAESAVLPEKELYELALIEMEPVLFEQYIKEYKDKNPKKLLHILYNYTFLEFRVNMNTGEKALSQERLKEILQMGIRVSEKNDIYFEFTDGRGEVTSDSNLVFYWDLARIQESAGDYNEALETYKTLEKLFIKTGEKLWYSSSREPSLDGIRGKIYTLKLKIDE